MSNIIKKARINSAVPLPAATFTAFSEKTPAGERSLDFTGTIEEEISVWRGTFESSRSARSRDTERKIRDAWNSGQKKGFEEGLENERRDKISSVDTLLIEAKRKREHAVRDIEIKVVDLAVLIAERIIGRALASHPEAVLDIVRDAMSRIVSGETVVLKVSEEDLPAINGRYEEWLGMSGNAREFRIEADRRLRRGDCLIETEGGIVDAVIANRLEYMVEEILKSE